MKYKEYDRIRRKPAKAQSTPRKGEFFGKGKNTLRERPTNVISATPRKHAKCIKNLQVPEPEGVSEEEPTPACVRCALGPTPQKDGKVLGIFDMVSSGTPSKASVELSTTATEAIVNGTPCKSAVSVSSEIKLSRTPQSSGRRHYFEAFAGTPVKRKREDEAYTPSTAKRQYATPSFLRRSFPPARIDEEDGESMTVAPPFKKRPMVRSLSSIIQGLKKQEEERMDDDWDILQEIEAEERGEVRPAGVPKVLVEDSQAVEMPLGPDKADASGDDADEVDAGALDANGKPRKVWKKKGLKRQTRRVIMRPVVHKRKKEGQKLSSDSDEDEPDALPETQQRYGRHEQATLSDDEDHVSSNDAEESDYRHDSQKSRHEATQRPRRDSKKRKKTKSREHEGGKHANADGEETGKKPKKVNAQAHANFRKLKIKNKNSKANGRGRKFGRR